MALQGVDYSRPPIVRQDPTWPILALSIVGVTSLAGHRGLGDEISSPPRLRFPDKYGQLKETNIYTRVRSTV